LKKEGKIFRSLISAISFRGLTTSPGVVFTRPQISYLKLPPNLDPYNPWIFVTSIRLHSIQSVSRL